jgi:cytochrome c biogenesis protein CcmG/thiol:disulfide interchange protein DsbE
VPIEARERVAVVLHSGEESSASAVADGAFRGAPPVTSGGIAGGIVAGMRRLVAVAALASLAVLAGACSGENVALRLIPEQNRVEAKDLSVKALDGSGDLTVARFRGKPVVLNFWASWCVPCRRETPDLVAFAKAHPGVRVVGVAVNDEPRDSRAFAGRYDIPYPLGSDPDADAQDVYGFPGLPATYFIDARGRLAADPRFGPVTPDVLEAFAKALGV